MTDQSVAGRRNNSASSKGLSYDENRPRRRSGRVRKKFKAFSVRFGMDLPFFLLVLVLVVIGLVMMFSASYANASYYFGDSYYFIKRQAAFAAIGIAVMIGVSYFDYHHFHKFAIPVLLISFAMLALVLVMPEIKKVHRWISLGALGQFQPSEIAKFAIVLVFAHLISLNFSRMGTFRYGVLPFPVQIWQLLHFYRFRTYSEQI